MAIADHKIVKCERCQAVVGQCRCMSKDKRVEYVPGPCNHCKDKSVLPQQEGEASSAAEMSLRQEPGVLPPVGPYYAVSNDLIGGWAVSTADKPLSDAGPDTYVIAETMTEYDARLITSLLNMFFTTNNPARLGEGVQPSGVDQRNTMR